MWMRTGQNAFKKKFPSASVAEETKPLPQQSYEKRLQSLIEKTKRELLLPAKFSRMPVGSVRGRDWWERREAAVVQFLALEQFKDSRTACCEYLSGPGQQWLGPTVKRRADLLLSLNDGSLLYINYHENAVHGSGRHTMSCADFVSSTLEYNADTVNLDAFCADYCTYMTESGLIRMKYMSVNCCDMFHGNDITLPTGKVVKFRGLTDMHDYMLQCHGDNYICRPVSLRSDGISEDEMLKHILHTETVNGFVSIIGGVETKIDDAGKIFSFCQQRAAVKDPSLFGPGFEKLVRQQVHRNWGERDKTFIDAKVQEVMQEKAQTEYTLTMKHFEKQTCISIPYFRWLVRERGLKWYTLMHVYQYTTNTICSDFLQKLLQRRHELKFAGEGKSLKSVTFKLIANACYG